MKRIAIASVAAAAILAAPAAHAQHGCPKCSIPNDADARFCKNCGERLA